MLPTRDFFVSLEFTATADEFEPLAELYLTGYVCRPFKCLLIHFIRILEDQESHTVPTPGAHNTILEGGIYLLYAKVSVTASHHNCLQDTSSVLDLNQQFCVSASIVQYVRPFELRLSVRMKVSSQFCQEQVEKNDVPKVEHLIKGKEEAENANTQEESEYGVAKIRELGENSSGGPKPKSHIIRSNGCPKRVLLIINTGSESAAKRARIQRVEHAIDRGLRKKHRSARKTREQQGALWRASQRLESMRDPFDDSEEDGNLPLSPFRSQGFGGLMQLLSEDDDFGEELSAYAAAFRCIDRTLDPQGGHRDPLLGTQDTNGLSETNLTTINCQKEQRATDENEGEIAHEGSKLGDPPVRTPHNHTLIPHQLFAADDSSLRSKQGHLEIPVTKDCSSIQNPSESQSFHSIPAHLNSPDEVRNTPNSLNWIPNTKFLDRYRFIVPKGRDVPYFELLSQWSPPTEHTPFKVFLDQQV